MQFPTSKSANQSNMDKRTSHTGSVPTGSETRSTSGTATGRRNKSRERVRSASSDDLLGQEGGRYQSDDMTVHGVGRSSSAHHRPKTAHRTRTPPHNHPRYAQSASRDNQKEFPLVDFENEPARRAPKKPESTQEKDASIRSHDQHGKT